MRIAPAPGDPSRLLDDLLVAPAPGHRPDLAAIPRGLVTRFAPAPTGALHLGHVVNALYVWGIARATSGRVVLRIEDHDRQRSRSTFESEMLDDLERLGLVPDEPSLAALRTATSSYRQSDDPAPYAGGLARLEARDLIYRCTCTRATFAEHAQRTRRPWQGPGCPGGCRAVTSMDAGDPPGRSTVATGDGGTVRVAIGGGRERWLDLGVGPMEDDVAAAGDPPAIDRHGNWTYGFSVVVDDLRHGVGLVIRGRDLLHATAGQIRLARLLGRDEPPLFLHHPLVRSTTGAKLSKADGATSVRSLLDAGWSRDELLGVAARLAGLQPTTEPVAVDDLARLFVG